jgi:hypothetical protein
MKALFGTIGKILFWIFAALVFFWTASLSLAALRQILPNDPLKPYVGLVLTDIGALTWLLVFIGQAKGLIQRAIALIMFVVDIAGVILLAAYELLAGGQQLAQIPPELGTAVIWGVIGLTLLNLIAAYVYHLAEPETWSEIEEGVLTDKLQGEALTQAQRNIEAEAQALGAILATRATARLKYNLRLPMSDTEQAEFSRQDLPASKRVIDAQPIPASESPSVFSNLFRKKRPPHPTQAPQAEPARVYQQTAPQVKAKTNKELRAKLEEEYKNQEITLEAYQLLKAQLDQDEAQEDPGQGNAPFQE